MEYWINLNDMIASASFVQDAGSLVERLLDEHVKLAVWTFAPNELPAVLRVSASGIDVAPIVPNLPAYVRDVTGGGPIKAMLTRFRQLSLGGKTSLLIYNAKDALRIIKQDFSLGLSILAEMELKRCKRLLPRHAVISSAVVDLAVALNNRQVVGRLLHLVQDHFNLSPLVETANLGITASKLIEWGIDTHEIVYLSPLNKVGYGMRPDQEICELVCTSGRAVVVGSDIDAAGELPLEEALSYVQSLDLRACLIPSSMLLAKSAA